jgi:hypothetical protein
MDFFFEEKISENIEFIIFLAINIIKMSQTKKYFKKNRYLLMRIKKLMYLCVDFELQNKHVKF